MEITNPEFIGRQFGAVNPKEDSIMSDSDLKRLGVERDVPYFTKEQIEAEIARQQALPRLDLNAPKSCVHCGKQIKVGDIICPHCDKHNCDEVGEAEIRAQRELNKLKTMNLSS